MTDTITPDIQALAIEIADEQCVVLIESYAERAEGRPGVWDVGTVDEQELDDENVVDMVAADLQRAVRYLAMRGRIERPVPQYPHLVTIRSTE